MSFCGIIGDIEPTWLDSEGLSVRWKISDFFSLSGEHGCCCYFSPEFDFGNARWQLGIYPKGTKSDKSSECVDISLERKDEDENSDEDSNEGVTVQFTLGIEGVEGVRKRERKHYTFYKSDYFIMFKYLPRQVFWDHQSILMPNNTLTISCKLKVVPNPAIEGASYQADEELKESLNKESHSSEKQDRSIKMNEKDAEAISEDGYSSEKQGIQKVVEDFGKLLVSCENSDVTVQVGDTEFRVHRAILSARCPVLSAMFQHQTVERESNKIIVEDCEPDIFRDFLQYLYTGNILSLTQKNVFSLYRVADKYLASDLKLECLKNMRKTLCVQTFCETVKLALTHSETDLLQQAIDFAIENIQQIVCSVEWQNFNCEYPREANEMLIKYFSPRT